jgi:hypothetical protein
MIVIDAAFELGTTAEPDERYPAVEATPTAPTAPSTPSGVT